MAIQTPVSNFLLIAYPLFYALEQYYSFFQTSGKFPDVRQFSKSKVSGLHIKGTHSLSIFTEISSYPWPLFRSRLLISWNITSGEMLKEISLSSVEDEVSTLLLLTAVYWLAKYLLNMLAIASRSVTSSLLTSRGEILSTFFPFHNVFSVLWLYGPSMTLPT